MRTYGFPFCSSLWRRGSLFLSFKLAIILDANYFALVTTASPILAPPRLSRSDSYLLILPLLGGGPTISLFASPEMGGN